MRFIDKLKSILKKKKVEVEETREIQSSELKEQIPEEQPLSTSKGETFIPPPSTSSSPTPLTPSPHPFTSRSEVGLRDKLEVIAAQIDSLKAQNQMIIERLKNLEKMIAEMRGIRYY